MMDMVGFAISFTLVALGLVGAVIHKRYSMTSIEEMNHLFSVDELFVPPQKIEVGVRDDKGVFDRFPAYGKSLLLVYVHRFIGQTRFESVDIVALRTKARMRVEFLDGKLYKWGYRPSGAGRLSMYIYDAATKHECLIFDRALIVAHSAKREAVRQTTEAVHA